MIFYRWVLFFNSGYPVPEVTWIKSIGDPLPADRVSRSSYEQELNIRDVRKTDEGTYQCTASNAAGAPQTHTVIVKVREHFFKCPANPQRHNQGERTQFKMHCKPHRHWQGERTHIQVHRKPLPSSSRLEHHQIHRKPTPSSSRREIKLNMSNSECWPFALKYRRCHLDLEIRGNSLQGDK